MKHLLVFGTRPEAIKMAPLIKKFQEKGLTLKVCITAQHREMLDQVLRFFEINPDFDLDLMQPGQDLHHLTAKIITGMKPVLDDFQPDITWVHGDTTTSMAVALAAFYTHSQVAHIEAGLRTFNRKEPFPEEINRNLTSKLTDFHFSPTAKSTDNLKKEAIPERQICQTGNTVIDALFYSSEKIAGGYRDKEIQELEKIIDPDKKLILITAHRRENHGAGFQSICKALRAFAENNPKAQLIYPVHLNPNVQEPVKDHLSAVENINLIEPLNYPAFVKLMEESYFVITDSGGIQEEAPGFGKPVLVLRETTERPEAVNAGTVHLVGADEDKIKREAENLFHNENFYEKMSKIHNPYGDGKACQRIVDFIKSHNLA